MRILFHAPGLAVFRPAIGIPHLLGVPAAATDNLLALGSTHKLTGNRGNIIHAEAPARIFRKTNTRSAFGNIALLKKSLGEGYPERIAANFDIIIISMANFIHPDHDGTTLYTALKALDGQVPFIVLGAGLQGNHRLTDMMPGNRNLLAIFNERAAVFGVRGEETANWLTDNGFENNKPLGCPSLYAYPQSILSIDGVAARSKGNAVDVMTAGHLSMRGGKIVPRGQALIEAFSDIKASYVFQDEFLTYGKTLVERLGSYNHGNCTADASLVNKWLSNQSGLPVNFDRYYYFNDAGAWRQAAFRHDVFIGDRFHGGVAVLQAGQPAIFLKHDNRVSELTKYFSLPNLTIEDFRKKGLKDTLKECLSKENLDTMKTLYKQRYNEFFAVMAPHGLTPEIKLDSHNNAPLNSQENSRKPLMERSSFFKVFKNNTSNITKLDHYIIRSAIPKRATELVISFEAADITINRKDHTRKGFGEQFLLDNGYAVLSILTNTANWFRDDGLVQYFKNQDFQSWLKKFARIHSYGSSMGGFGALVFADLLNVSNVIALQPISTLAADLVPWEKRFKPGRGLNWNGSYRDVAEGIKGPQRIYTIYDPKSEDFQHVDRIRNLANERVATLHIQGAQHAVPRYLQKHNILKPLVLRCLKMEPIFETQKFLTEHFHKID